MSPAKKGDIRKSFRQDDFLRKSNITQNLERLSIDRDSNLEMIIQEYKRNNFSHYDKA